MRFIILFLGLLAGTGAVPQLLKQRAADHDLLEKQQDIIHLFENIVGDILDERIRKLGVNYDIEGNIDNYENPSVVKYYIQAVRSGHIQPKDTTFSTLISDLRKEVTLLTQIFVGAKNYDIFLKTAAWARRHINQEQFVEAFTRAIILRPDTYGIILPPPYEVFPHYFFDSRILQQVHDFVNRYVLDTHSTNDYVHYIVANYTSTLPDNEYKVSHFIEDIGLATYYSYIQLAADLHYYDHEKIYRKGREVGETQYNVDHGSRYYYIHQQLVARYNLERFTSSIGPIEPIEYDHITIPYKPQLRYINGLEFPGRSDDIHFKHDHHYRELVRLVHTLENRIFEAIDSGHVITPEGKFLSLYQQDGLNILGNLVEGTGRSINPRYYGSIQVASRQLFGVTPHFNNIYEYTPSVLELGQTAIRDPAFFKLYNRILGIFRHYQQSLPAYQYNDVVVPGVKIDRVDVSDLITYFNNYKVALDNVIAQPTNRTHQYPKIKGCLKRLDHKPYEFKIYIQSEKYIPNAVIRVYVGPKYNFEGKLLDINEHREYFVEVDQFYYTLDKGHNVIVRKSQQANGQSYDWFSIQDIAEHVQNAVKSQDPFYVTEPHQYYSFPARLVLPKGTKEGYPLQFLFIVSTSDHQVSNFGPVIPAQCQSYNPYYHHLVTVDENRDLSQTHIDSHGEKSYAAVIPEYDADRQRDYSYTEYPHWQQSHYKSDAGVLHDRQIHEHVSSQYHIDNERDNHLPNQHVQYIHNNEHQEDHHKGQVGLDRVISGHSSQVTDDALHQIPNSQSFSDQSRKSDASGHYYGNVHHSRTGAWKEHDQPHDQYYRNKFTVDVIGGGVSLDGKPLGYPFDRPLAHSIFYASNVYIKNVPVYHQDDLNTDCRK